MTTTRTMTATTTTTPTTMTTVVAWRRRWRQWRRQQRHQQRWRRQRWHASRLTKIVSKHSNVFWVEKNLESQPNVERKCWRAWVNIEPSVMGSSDKGDQSHRRSQWKEGIVENSQQLIQSKASELSLRRLMMILMTPTGLLAKFQTYN